MHLASPSLRHEHDLLHSLACVQQREPFPFVSAKASLSVEHALSQATAGPKLLASITCICVGDTIALSAMPAVCSLQTIKCTIWRPLELRCSRAFLMCIACISNTQNSQGINILRAGDIHAAGNVHVSRPVREPELGRPSAELKLVNARSPPHDLPETLPEVLLPHRVSSGDELTCSGSACAG